MSSEEDLVCAVDFTSGKILYYINPQTGERKLVDEDTKVNNKDDNKGDSEKQMPQGEEVNSERKVLINADHELDKQNKIQAIPPESDGSTAMGKVTNLPPTTSPALPPVVLPVEGLVGKKTHNCSGRSSNCEECKKSFAESLNRVNQQFLEKTLSSKTLKIFMCDKCGINFLDRRLLNKHRLHHEFHLTQEALKWKNYTSKKPIPKRQPIPEPKDFLAKRKAIQDERRRLKELFSGRRVTQLKSTSDFKLATGAAFPVKEEVDTRATETEVQSNTRAPVNGVEFPTRATVKELSPRVVENVSGAGRKEMVASAPESEVALNNRAPANKVEIPSRAPVNVLSSRVAESIPVSVSKGTVTRVPESEMEFKTRAPTENELKFYTRAPQNEVESRRRSPVHELSPRVPESVPATTSKEDTVSRTNTLIYQEPFVVVSGEVVTPKIVNTYSLVDYSAKPSPQVELITEEDKIVTSKPMPLETPAIQIAKVMGGVNSHVHNHSASTSKSTDCAECNRSFQESMEKLVSHAKAAGLPLGKVKKPKVLKRATRAAKSAYLENTQTVTQSGAVRESEYYSGPEKPQQSSFVKSVDQMNMVLRSEKPQQSNLIRSVDQANMVLRSEKPQQSSLIKSVDQASMVLRSKERAKTPPTLRRYSSALNTPVESPINLDLDGVKKPTSDVSGTAERRSFESSGDLEVISRARNINDSDEGDEIVIASVEKRQRIGDTPKQAKSTSVVHVSEQRNLNEVNVESVLKAIPTSTPHSHSSTGNSTDCAECQKSFAQSLNQLSAELLAKTLSSRATMIYSCDQCDKHFVEKRQLSKHRHEKHAHSPFMCARCERQFSSKRALNIHYRVHVGEKVYQCEYCATQCDNECAFDDHMRSHTGGFKCPQCPMTFPRRSRLTIHIRTHFNKGYHCDQCGKSFLHSRSLMRHELLHSGQRPFRCSDPQCNRTFGRQDHLTDHMRTHTGEKPYQCPHCSKNFSQSGVLNRHMRTAHLVESGEDSDESMGVEYIV